MALGDARPWQEGGNRRTVLVDGVPVHETVLLIDPSPRRFVALTAPDAAARGTVLIWSPLWSEQMKNYRREVLLARRLASLGFTTARFHYRGVGHSGGDPAAVDLTTMTEDGLAVAAFLQDLVEAVPTGFVATRVAGLAAARAAADASARAMVIWDPLANGDRFFRDVLRSRLLAGLRPGSSPVRRDDLLDELDAAGFLEVLGFSIGARTYHSIAGQSLHDALGAWPGPLELVAFDRKGERPEAMRSLADELAARGCQTRLDAFAFEEAWWFTADIRQLDNTGSESIPLVESTARWLERQLAPVGVRT